MAAGTRAYMNLGVNAYAHELMRAHTRVCEQPTKRNRTTRQARMNQQPTRAHTRPHQRQAPARPPPHLSAGRNAGGDPRGRRQREKGGGQRHPGTPPQASRGTMGAEPGRTPRRGRIGRGRRERRRSERRTTQKCTRQQRPPGEHQTGTRRPIRTLPRGDFHRPPSRAGGSDKASQAPEPSGGRAISRRGHARLETSQQNMRGSRRRPA